MNIQMRAYSDNDLQEMISIWNAVVENGTAFPQQETLNEKTGQAFFASQTYCGVAETETGNVVFCTRTMSGDAGISLMQVTLCYPRCVGRA